MGKFSLELSTPGYQKLIGDTLGDKTLARNFVAEISTVVGNNATLQSCSTGSIVSAGLLAQTLKLSLAPTLGYAYVIPYGTKAQFQVGWKGLVQLAQRSGQYARLGVREVHDGEYVGQDEFGDDLFKFSHEHDDKKVVGYYAYFELLNGFKKTVYWTKAQVEKHAKQYSQAYKQGRATKWNDEFDAMAMKTVLKQLLTKWGPMSTEMQLAAKADQSVIRQENGQFQFDYIDGTDAVPQHTGKTNIEVPSIPEEDPAPTTDQYGVVDPDDHPF